MITECSKIAWNHYKNRLKRNKLGPDNGPTLDQIRTYETPKLGPDNNFTACIYIYIYAVKLKIGPIVALFKVKNWSIFLFFFFENRIPPAERRGFWKTSKKDNKKTQFLKLKTGPIMLRNILGPVFNFNLDQFLTLELCYLCVCVFFGGGAETPIL